MIEVRDYCAKHKVDLVLLQEPCVLRGEVKGLGGRARIVQAEEGCKAAIAVFNESMKVMKVAGAMSKWVASAEIEWNDEKYVCMSMYCESGREMNETFERVEWVMERYPEHRLLVGMDANAKNDMWYSGRADARGNELERMLLTRDLCVLNVEGQPFTFRGYRRQETNIDVTVADKSTERLVKSWTVKDDLELADHRAIIIELSDEAEKARNRIKNRFKVKDVNWDAFREELKNEWATRETVPRDDEREIEKRIERLEACIVNTCERVCGRKKTGVNAGVSWWTEELTNMQREVRTARIEYQREEREIEKRRKKVKYKRKLRVFRKKIEKVKRDGWRKFVTEVGSADPWSVVYKIQCKKMKTEKVMSTIESNNGETIGRSETMRVLCEKMFPRDSRDGETEEHRLLRERINESSAGENDTFVSMAMIEQGLGEMKNGKSPGNDHIEVQVLKESWPVIGQELAWIVRECIRLGTFPDRWKTGKLVVLLKPGKPAKEAGSYRPITLLPVCGKLLEKVAVRKMRAWMHESGVISNRQYGFVKRRGTSDALKEVKRLVNMSESKYVLGLFVDISGAFDNAWPPLILEIMRSKNCPDNLVSFVREYMRGRSVEIGKRSVEDVWSVEKGCPQGSILGPVLWIILLHEWLDKEFGEGVNVVAYADDVAILVHCNTQRELTTRANELLEDLNRWCARAKLNVSVSKTKGVLLKGAVQQQGLGPIMKAIAWRPRLTLGRNRIACESEVVYLGVKVDESWLFTQHVKEASSKAKVAMQRMKRVNGNGWGVGWRVMRIIYLGVFLPIITYGSVMWGDRVWQTHIKRTLRAAQRTALLASTNAFRTVSWSALCTLTGQLPIERQVKIKADVDSMRCDLNARGMNEKEVWDRVRNFKRLREDEEWDGWQAEYASARRDERYGGREIDLRIKSIVSDAKAWAKNRFTCDQWIVGYITGHVGVNAYLKERRTIEDDKCECGEIESVDHVMWNCALYIEIQERMKEKMGTNDPSDVSKKRVYEALRWGMREVMAARRSRMREAREREERFRVPLG